MRQTDELILNRPYILSLIRDEKTQTLAELHAHFALDDASLQAEPHRYASTMQARQVLKWTIQSFEDAGFIKTTKGRLIATDVVTKLKTELGISLAEIAQKPRSAIWVDPIFDSRDATQVSAEVFVLMPFRDDLAPVYHDRIRKVATAVGLSVARADDFFTTNAIIEDIWRGIFGSLVLIADCTDRNPNVFYEIGIAHTVGKPVFLITQKIADVPFDIGHFRCIEYEFTPRGMRSFEDALSRTLQPFVHESRRAEQKD